MAEKYRIERVLPLPRRGRTARLDVMTDTALILIDVQRGFDVDGWGPRNNPGAEANIKGTARRVAVATPPVGARAPRLAEAGSPLRPGQPGNDFKPNSTARGRIWCSARR